MRTQTMSLPTNVAVFNQKLIRCTCLHSYALFTLRAWTITGRRASTRRSTRVDQYRCQSLARRGSGAKTVLRGHIASGTLGNTLATAPPRGPIFLVGARPHDPPPLSLALRLTRVDARNVNKALHLSALVTSAVPATLVLSFR